MRAQVETIKSVKEEEVIQTHVTKGLLMKRIVTVVALCALLGIGGTVVTGCDSDEASDIGYVALHNDFNNAELERQPPWTICEAWYNDTYFSGPILLGDTSEEQSVNAGLGYVYMILAWNDPTCALENCLPVASKNEEETVSGQRHVIHLNAPNHQGPCPPEGVAPISEDRYNKILELWPDYTFKSYADRTENPPCLD